MKHLFTPSKVNLRLASVANGTLAAFSLLLIVPLAAHAQSAEDATAQDATAQDTKATTEAASNDTTNQNVATKPDGIYWRETPANTDILIVRAIFDQRGYQLFPKTGQPILVPFERENLYVMKFAPSRDGNMYFWHGENDRVPTLFLPSDGFIGNAAVPESGWYPFPDGYQGNRAIYAGMAQNWNDFVQMPWYQGVQYSGGYFGYTPITAGATYRAIPGTTIYYGQQYYTLPQYISKAQTYPTGQYSFKSAPMAHYNYVRVQPVTPNTGTGPYVGPRFNPGVAVPAQNFPTGIGSISRGNNNIGRVQPITRGQRDNRIQPRPNMGNNRYNNNLPVGGQPAPRGFGSAPGFQAGMQQRFNPQAGARPNVPGRAPARAPMPSRRPR